MTTYKGKTVKAKLGKSRVIGTVIRERITNDAHAIFIQTSEEPKTGIAIRIGDPWKVKVIEPPIELPTKPYALVVPPANLANLLTPFILEPVYAGDLAWVADGNEVDPKEVRNRLREGWTVAFEGREEN